MSNDLSLIDNTLDAKKETAYPRMDNTILLKQELNTKLSLLKSLDLSQVTVNMWISNVSTSNKVKRFSSIKRLNIDVITETKLTEYVKTCIEHKEHIQEFKNINTEQDNRFFYLESTSTDLSQFVEVISKEQILPLDKIDDLNKFNSYIIQLVLPDGNSLYSFKYVKSSWKVNKSSGSFLKGLRLNNQLVAKIESSNCFQITSDIDFIQFHGDVFISNSRSFEVAMNYHERLKEKKSEAIDSLCSSKSIPIHSKDTLVSVIGTDKHLMRQLASVHDKKYYENSLWLKKLKEVADEAGDWKIEFDSDNKIIIKDDKEYIKEILTLLQNKRVKTVVDGVLCDVDGELIAYQ